MTKLPFLAKAAVLTLALCAVSPVAWTADAEPGKDHQLVGRYEGSKLTFYHHVKFNEINLLKGPEESALNLEGAISYYYYDYPADVSSLEVQRNYESSFKAKGLEILYSEKDGLDLGMRLNGVTRWPTILIRNECGYHGTVRYMLAKHDTTHVSIAVCDKIAGNPGSIYVAVVENKAMDTGKIKFVDASAMQKSINDTGRVSLYGIHFDFDKDVINPDSQNTIYEMIKLMQGNPQLRLRIVGHTDSQGTEAHNLDLSSRRAGAVIRSLVGAGIAVERLSSGGAGSSEPVATNDTEEGRAKNRRVELVQQ